MTFEATAAIVLRLDGQCKSGKNGIKITRTGRHYPTPQFEAWRASYGYQLRGQTNAKVISQPIKAIVRYWPGDKIRRDATGILDALWHLFEFTGLLADDALIQAVDYQQMPLDKAQPRVEVRLEPIRQC